MIRELCWSGSDDSNLWILQDFDGPVRFAARAWRVEDGTWHGSVHFPGSRSVPIAGDVRSAPVKRRAEARYLREPYLEAVRWCGEYHAAIAQEARFAAIPGVRRMAQNSRTLARARLVRLGVPKVDSGEVPSPRDLAANPEVWGFPAWCPRGEPFSLLVPDHPGTLELPPWTHTLS